MKISCQFLVNLLIFNVIILTVGIFNAQAWEPLAPKKASRPATEFNQYQEAINKTMTMVSNPVARKLANSFGLNVLNITWEDTGRFKNSAVGPNISDMTIQVAVEDPKTKKLKVSLMPVIRYPNYSDKTADIDPRDFTLLVGNQHGGKLKRISLYQLLENPTAYLTNSKSWAHKNKSLLAGRDSKVLVSAQACFLPVPKKGVATFNPVLFNYQSVSGDPAVLTVLVTREGTSLTIIDNKRNAFKSGSVWGQRLFHNENGQRASLTGTRLSDFRSGLSNANIKLPSNKEKSGLNMVLLIQIPLKQKNPMRHNDYAESFAYSAPMPGLMLKEKKSDVEVAVIGHGDLEGPFTEIDNLSIERDPRFPVRVTVQFYKATSNGVVGEKDLAQIKEEIDSVYARSEYVGSLVVAGNTGRVTEYEGPKVEPKDWWENFWKRHEKNTGDSKEKAIEKLRNLIGQNYQNRPVTDLYLRNLLRDT